MYECECWKMYKTDNIVKQRLRESFPLQNTSQRRKTFGKYQIWKFDCDVQCDIQVPENLGYYFSNFPPLLKNIMLVKMTFVRLWRKYREGRTFGST